jgi:hypothetical protein
MAELEKGKNYWWWAYDWSKFCIHLNNCFCSISYFTMLYFQIADHYIDVLYPQNSLISFVTALHSFVLLLFPLLSGIADYVGIKNHL